MEQMKLKLFREGHHHANVSRHVTGLRRSYSKTVMERQLPYLLSINYVHTQPNPAGMKGSQVLFGDKLIIEQERQ